MHACVERLCLLAALAAVAGVLPNVAGAEPEAAAPAKLTDEQRADLDGLMGKFREATTRGQRANYFTRMLRVAPAAVTEVLAEVDRQFDDREGEYARQLAPHIADAYAKRLLRLTDKQVYQALMTRRLWLYYIQSTSAQHDFQNVFLKPCDVMAEALLPKLQSIHNRDLAALRNRLVEFAAYRQRCRSILGVDPDPTKTKISPTGLPYPFLDNPPTFQTTLDYLDRTLVLAYSVASPGARDVLMLNVGAAKEHDVEESAFVFFGNRVRMLVGSVVWRADALMSACARDHSNDRKEGRASGHSSTVPGKEGFTKRLKRFGSWGRSEGAGGGSSGERYIRALSYGGGHTGPLYSPKRNVVGVGQRRGAYTSIYRTEKKYLHPCPALAGEIFMPPGVQREEVEESETLAAIYKALHEKRFEDAHALIAEAEVASDREKMILRFFSMSIRVEIDWCFEGITHIAKVGDVYAVRGRLDDAAARFGQLAAFRKRAGPFEARMSQGDLVAELANGKRFRELLKTSYTAPALTRFIADVGESSVYAKAAQWSLEKDLGAEEKGFSPLGYFFTNDRGLARYGYPGPWK